MRAMVCQIVAFLAAMLDERFLFPVVAVHLVSRYKIWQWVRLNCVLSARRYWKDWEKNQELSVKEGRQVIGSNYYTGEVVRGARAERVDAVVGR